MNLVDRAGVLTSHTELLERSCKWIWQMDLADGPFGNDLLDRPLGRITETDLADGLLRQTLST
jgi:hypothetical protein